MKRNSLTISLTILGTLLVMMFHHTAVAQERIVTLPAETDLVKFINDDAAARTAFLPGQTIYELARDGYYVCRSSLTTLGLSSVHPRSSGNGTQTDHPSRES
jgi:hypothetical protein